MEQIQAKLYPKQEDKKREQIVDAFRKPFVKTQQQQIIDKFDSNKVQQIINKF